MRKVPADIKLKALRAFLTRKQHGMSVTFISKKYGVSRQYLYHLSRDKICKLALKGLTAEDNRK